MQVDNVVCAFCGCVCDDINVTVEDGRITQAKNACVLGKAWFLSHGQPSDRPVALIDGQPANLDEAVEAAARFLAQSHYSLIYGLSSTSCEAQRQAVALAEVLGGCIDCCTSVCHGPSGMALQGIGEPTCTLGEVKNRADLVVYWGSNPAESHPRHMTRYAVTPKGMFIPRGRKDRTIVLIDVRPTPSARAADLFLQVKPGKDFELLWALRALVKGQVLDEAGLAGTGMTLAQLTDLAERMKRCKFGALFIGQGLTQSRGKHLNTSAAFLLVRDLNSVTKFASMPMRGHGNVTGVDNVLGWQTGYPFGVNFSRGYPRFNPGEFTVVDVLSRGEADAALIVASDPVASLPRKAAQRLTEVPTIALDTHESETTRIARVAFTTATAGIHVEGTVYRMDNVPLHLRKVLPSPYPSDEEVLGRLLARVKDQAMLRIINGEVYDPINGINGEVRDICVQDGRIVADVTGGQTIDAQGMVVMPGGVDMHCHIAGPKVNLARKMRPEDHRTDVLPRTPITRSGTGGSVPSTFTTGYRYAAMGYTTAFDAAVPPLAARHAHEEFCDTPVVDKGFFVLMGNNEFIMQHIAAKQPEQARDYAAWLLQATKGYAIKLVNPGGVELWKFRGNVHTLDDEVTGFGVTPRQIIQTMADVSKELGLPHPMHLHCNNLGIAGNWETTLETMKALDGRRGHLTHIQFHSYGGKPGGLFVSKAPELAEYVNTHPNLTVDVGQVMFGDTTSMTGDGPLGYLLYQVTGRKWANVDVENEEGCGIVPIEYKDKNHVHTTQWAIGLEWFLLVQDPWRIALTTDHPNGASFVSYPRIIRMLMDREFRREMMKQVHPKALAKTTLPELDREYSLFEIAIVTRAGPARPSGLKNKGHLGIGADADITIYDKDDDKEKMFACPRYVIKDGRVLVEDGHIREDTYGRTFFVAPAYDPAIEADIREHFDKYYTIRFENYPVQLEHYLPRHEVVACSG